MSSDNADGQPPIEKNGWITVRERTLHKALFLYEYDHVYYLFLLKKITEIAILDRKIKLCILFSNTVKLGHNDK
jgi:hypothetical protein